MRTIPLIDLRNSTPIELLKTRQDQAKELIRASTQVNGKITRLMFPYALSWADHASKKWLEHTQNPYLSEIYRYAEILDVTGIYALNLSYEWGCTSGVYKRDNQDLILIRALDWPLAGLGENLVVAHQSGKAGDFYNITWPAVSGVFSGMAPNRFAIVLNQAPMRRYNMPTFFDWLMNRAHMFSSRGLPPSHLLRKVFETAKNYEEAKAMLTHEEIALPVIFTISGTKEGEACVIERIEKDARLRYMQQNSVCAANHFESGFKNEGYGWRPRANDSAGRFRLASSIDPESIGSNFEWFLNPIANVQTRMVMIANAAKGQLCVMGTDGAKPVTDLFSL